MTTAAPVFRYVTGGTMPPAQLTDFGAEEARPLLAGLVGEGAEALLARVDFPRSSLHATVPRLAGAGGLSVAATPALRR